MEANEKYVLAMYDVRSKQEFIFRTNKIKEIVGGSCIIRDCYQDYLFPAAIKYREHTDISFEEIRKGGYDPAIYQYNKKSDNQESDNEEKSADSKLLQKESEKFSVNEFEKRMKGTQYLGEVIYEGGGNFLVLYKNATVCTGINKIFSKEIMREINTLLVTCTYKELENGFANFKEDDHELKRIHRMHEEQESVIRPVNTLPFVQVDLSTSMPLTGLYAREESGEKEKVSSESAAKLNKYHQVFSEKEYGENLLDNLVEKKGEESLLAVLFIDGNNMGGQVDNCLRDIGQDYESSINALRQFSEDIQEKYVDQRKKAIEEALNDKYKDKTDKTDERSKRRYIVFAGDEMSFICNARDAFLALKAYFKELPKGCSACAGIAVFHSHAPYAEAYKIAEECCESGKKRMKQDSMERKYDALKQKINSTACYVDFHYCQGGLGMSLDHIREREVGKMISKPWLIKYNSENADGMPTDIITMEDVKSVVKDLQEIDSRTSIKTLVEAAKHSLSAFDLEMSRIYAHQKSDVREKIVHTFKELNGELRRRLVYDVGMMYDLWFQNESGEREASVNEENYDKTSD